MSPFGFEKKLRIFIDPNLLQYDEMWAAAGTWNDVFPITPNDLVRASGAQRPTSNAAEHQLADERRLSSGTPSATANGMLKSAWVGYPSASDIPVSRRNQRTSD